MGVPSLLLLLLLNHSLYLFFGITFFFRINFFDCCFSSPYPSPLPFSYLSPPPLPLRPPPRSFCVCLVFCVFRDFFVFEEYDVFSLSIIYQNYFSFVRNASLLLHFSVLSFSSLFLVLIHGMRGQKEGTCRINVAFSCSLLLFLLFFAFPLLLVLMFSVLFALNMRGSSSPPFS